MTGFPLYLFGLFLVGLWVRRRPRPSLAHLIGLWWIGLITARVLPGLLGASVSATGIPMWVSQVIGAIGALVLLRAVIGFTAWGRTDSQRTRIYAGGFVLALLLIGVLPSGGTAIAIIPAIPWIWTARWRRDAGATNLALICLAGVVTVFLSPVAFGADIALREHPVLPGLGRIWVLSVVWGLSYGLIMIGGSATRIHLSIQRIGRRLLVSHVLAGVVPLLLAVTFVLVAGALFLSTYRGTVAQRLLVLTAAGAERRMRHDLTEWGEVRTPPFGEETSGQILLSRFGEGPILRVGGALGFPADSLFAEKVATEDALLLWDGAELFLRARVDTLVSGRPFCAEVLAPVDSVRMVRISELIGVPVRVSPLVHVMRSGKGVQIGAGFDSAEQEEETQPEERDAGRSVPNRREVQAAGADSSDSTAQVVRRGPIGPPKPKGSDFPGGAIASCLEWTGSDLKQTMVPISSSARIGEPIQALFSIARENPLAIVVLAVLGMIAIFLIGAIGVTISMVASMGRSITRAVRALTDATAALRGGNLAYRVTIEGNDELWHVASNFNDMAEGLERMREMEREGQRREEELRLARAIQDRLLPSGPPMLDRVELAGVSLPAREIGGDYFDYLVLDGGLVGITVADVSGKGTPAALLMSAFRASLRSQDLAELGPAEVLGRVNRFIHSSVDPGRFITAFLCLFNPATGELRYANAGHDPPLLLHLDGEIVELTGGGLILGMLPQIVYEEARAQVPPGALLTIFTDGVTEARDPEGGFFGPENLERILKATRGMPCIDIVRRVVDEIQTYAGTSPQSDDITLVLARRR
jgi:serine phosphatase RsbU (regulator of sigma subunit)